MARLRQTYIILILTILMTIPLAGCGIFGGGVKFKSRLKLKVAVMPFEDQAGVGGEEVGMSTTKLVAEELSKDDRLIIVPWTDVENYISEHGISYPLTQNTATMVGRSLGLNVIIIGSITEISKITKPAGWLKWIPLLAKKKEFVNAVLLARAIDVENGIILGADTAKGETETGRSLEEFFISESNQSMHQYSISESMDIAVEELAEEILKGLGQVSWKGFIREVSGETVVMSSGKDVGIRSGDSFVIYSPGEEITNAAGQTYVIPGPVKATLEAAEIFESKTNLRIVSGEAHPGEAVHQIEQ